MKKEQHMTRRLAALAITSMLLFVASAASAQDAPEKLLKYTADDTGFLVGMDVKTASKNPAYTAILAELKKENDVREGIQVLKDKAGFDIEKDLHSVVVSMPTPEGSGNNLGKQFIVVLSGKFDAKKYAELIKAEEKRKVGAFEVLSPESNVDVSLINGTTFVIISGPAAYREKGWATINGKGKSALDHPGMSKLIKAANIKKNHAWLMANTRSLTQPETSPQVNSAIVELNLKSGMAITARLKMKSAEDATKAKEDLEKSLPSGKAFASMIGAEALIENLKTTVAKDLMTLNTSMTEAQLKKSIDLIKAQQNKKSTPAVKEAPPTK